MRLVTITLSVLASAGLLAFSAPSAEPAPAAVRAGTFDIDPTHSNVLYKIMHREASFFYGRFREVTGSFEYDADDASKCSMVLEIPSAGVDTRSEKLDQHLRSPDFFDAKQFPVIRFESTKVTSPSTGLYEVTGELDLHGVKKTLTFEVEQIGRSESRGQVLLGFHSRFVIDRTDFGMTYGLGGALGSDVELIVSIEAGER